MFAGKHFDEAENSPRSILRTLTPFREFDVDKDELVDRDEFEELAKECSIRNERRAKRNSKLLPFQKQATLEDCDAVDKVFVPTRTIAGLASPSAIRRQRQRIAEAAGRPGTIGETYHWGDCTGLPEGLCPKDTNCEWKKTGCRARPGHRSGYLYSPPTTNPKGHAELLASTSQYVGKQEVLFSNTHDAEAAALRKLGRSGRRGSVKVISPPTIAEAQFGLPSGAKLNREGYVVRDVEIPFTRSRRGRGKK
jgi:hypothetical protein